MPPAALGRLLDHLRPGEPADAALVAAFVARRDQAAFAQLVRRHGPMVLGVCRRTLGNASDADDAFQATFLVLATRAASVRRPALLGNWLYGVARRTALKARTTSARRRRHEMSVQPPPPAAAASSDLGEHLDRELERLPEKYREVLVLCELQGLRRKEAAQRLGLPEGTVSSRLATAKRTLARRLARFGVALGSAVLARDVAAAPTEALVQQTARAAATGVVSPRVTALVQGVLNAMLIDKLKLFAMLVLAVAGLALGAAWCRSPAATPEAEGPQWKAPVAEAPPPIAAAPAEPAGLEPAPRAPAFQADNCLPCHKDPGNGSRREDYRDHIEHYKLMFARRPRKDVFDKAQQAVLALPATGDSGDKVAMLANLARLKVKANDLKGAAETLAEAVKIAEAMKDDGPRALALGGIAEQYASLGKVTVARKLVERMTSTETTKHAVDAARGRALAEIALAQLRAGDLEAAQETVEAIAEFDADLADATVVRVAVAQARARDDRGALATLKGARSSQTRVQGMVRVAKVQAEEAHQEAALKTLEAARKQMPVAQKGKEAELAFLYRELARAHGELGDADGALAWIERLESPSLRAAALLGLAEGLGK
jgi:RNA polymerase sigma factor (sigma-70 family)